MMPSMLASPNAVVALIHSVRIQRSQLIALFGLQSPELELVIYVGMDEYLLLRAYGSVAIGYDEDRIHGLRVVQVNETSYLKLGVTLK